MTILIINPTGTQIAIALIACIGSWVLLYLYVRCWSKKTIKKMDKEFKDNTVTFFEDMDVFSEDTHILLSERPFVEYHAGCN